MTEIALELRGKGGSPVLVFSGPEPEQTINLLLLHAVTALPLIHPDHIALWPEGKVYRLEGAELSPSGALVANYFPGSRLIVGRDEVAGYLGQRNINADCVPYMGGTNGGKA